MRREAFWHATTLGLMLGGVLWACGPASFSAFPGDEDAGDEDAGAGDDAGQGDDGTLADAPNPEPDAGATAADGDTASDSSDDWTATDCSDIPKADGAFVSPKGVDSANCTPDTPCATIAAGVAYATRNARDTVYLDKGTYVEPLKLNSGLTYSGGWARLDSGSWQRVCDAGRASAAVIQAPAGANITADAVDLGGTATLDTLTLRSRAAAAAASESFYGLRVIGASSHVVLRGVVIGTAAAGAGTIGGTGSVGSAAPATCAAGDGGTPPPGGGGTGAPAGAFTAAGWQPSTGGLGNPGTGPGGNSGTNVVCIGPSYGCIARTCKSVKGADCCSSASTPGCGGGPGGGGSGGSGGGSSVAVFVWGGSVDAETSRLTAGPGGDGGPGGGGGSGGAPTTGSPGASATCPAGCGDNPNPGCTTMCSCSEDSEFTPTAAPFSGAVGATGGVGGGGAGGSSLAVFVGGSGAFNPTASVVLAHGTAGKGGDAPNPGAPGVAADRN